MAEHQTKPDQQLLQLLLNETAARHSHLCPRQVLAVRLGLHALRSLELVGCDYQPRFLNLEKRLLTIVETDGCGADGISVATSCSVGRRTLRVFDFGKLAATLVDTKNRKAVRVAPSPHSRQLAVDLASDAIDRWHAYLQAYQEIPDDELVVLEPVRLTKSLSEILSKPNRLAICSKCGEEIMNEREVQGVNGVLCLSCSGEGYYETLH
jgi:formylmethanofuran dehydrogenase subunit E